MKKIIFVITSLGGGGAERVFSHILKNIDKTKFDIILAIGKKDGPFLKDVPKEIKVIELSGTKKASDSFFELLKLIKKENPDIVFSTLGMVSTAALCSLFVSKNIRFISRLGNTISADLDRVKKESYIKYIAQSIYYWVVINTTEVLTQAKYMKEDLKSLYKSARKRKIHQIYNPIESIDKHSYDKIAKKTIDLFTVGRFAWQKGYNFLIPAFKEVLTKYPNARLTFIGTGDLEEEIKLLSKELNIYKYIEFAGYQEKPFEYLTSPDIFVSSSRFEGFSNVIIESLANAIPVVATDCPSGNKEVISNGKNGWLSSMDGDIIDNLAKAMILAIEEYKGLDMKSEQIKIINKLNIKTIVKQYEDLFEGE